MNTKKALSKCSFGVSSVYFVDTSTDIVIPATQGS